MQGEGTQRVVVHEAGAFKLVRRDEKGISLFNRFSILTAPSTDIGTSDVHNSQVPPSSYISPTPRITRGASSHNASHSLAITQLASHRIASSSHNGIASAVSLARARVSHSSHSHSPTHSAHVHNINESPSSHTVDASHASISPATSSHHDHSSSLFTMTSTNRPLIKINGFVNQQPAVFLIDSGGSGNFASQQFVSRHSACITALPSFGTVSLADGTTRATSIVKSANINIHSYSDTLDLVVCPLAGYDIILGMPWLMHYNPCIDWRQHRISFVDEHRRSHTLVGTTMPPVSSVPSSSSVTKLATVIVPTSH